MQALLLQELLLVAQVPQAVPVPLQVWVPLQLELSLPGQFLEALGVQTPPVTVKLALLKPHPVAPLGAFQPKPEICTVPAATPFIVLPETLATPLLEELNCPPLQPEGAEAAVVLPTIMGEAGDSETLPAGQTAAWQV